MRWCQGIIISDAFAERQPCRIRLTETSQEKTGQDREARKKRPPLCTKNFEKNKNIFVHIPIMVIGGRGPTHRRKQKENR